MNHTLFISDLHLEPEKPEITHCFLNFLKNQALQAEALYILGDFFEVWVGDDDSSSFNRSIIHALRTMTDHKIPVYLMPGNRDFLIGNRFAKESGCQLLKDPTLIDLYGVPTILAHGDQLCTKDKKHQTFRKYTKGPIFRCIFLALPLWLRKKIARIIRQKSQKHTSITHYDLMNVTPEAVTSLFQKYGATRLIHGHTHKPGTTNVDGNQRFVLGDWNTHGSALRCDAKSCELIIISP